MVSRMVWLMRVKGEGFGGLVKAARPEFAASASFPLVWPAAFCAALCLVRNTFCGILATKSELWWHVETPLSRWEGAGDGGFPKRKQLFSLSAGANCPCHTLFRGDMGP